MTTVGYHMHYGVWSQVVSRVVSKSTGNGGGGIDCTANDVTCLEWVVLSPLILMETVRRPATYNAERVLSMKSEGQPTEPRPF